MKKNIRNFLIAAAGFIMLTPLALADNPTIQNVTMSPVPFYNNIPNQTATLEIQYDLNTGGAATAPVIEQILDSNSKIVYDFANPGPANLGTGHYQLFWDGTCNANYSGAPCVAGSPVPSGKYQLLLSATTNTPPPAQYLSSPFDVDQVVAPLVSLTSQAPGVYYSGTGNYTLNYNLVRNNGTAWIVHLKITSVNSSGETTTIANPATADGNAAITWNGMINGTTAPLGSYNYDLWATASINGYSVDSNHLTGTFAISNPNTSSTEIAGLQVMPSPYDPTNGFLTLSYSLSNSGGSTTINAAVYSANNLNTPLKTWSFVKQSNGNNSMTWDGKDALSNPVPNGDYIFQVSGVDGSNVLPPVSINFTVTSLPPASNCDGFKDVSPSDADCPAITYMKSIGAMTGNPDGTFGEFNLLQRDQVIKIILQSFNKFNLQIDYCKNTKPFFDVSESDWSYEYLCDAKQLGIATGYLSGPDQGYYRPARTVNRIEFLALVLRNVAEVMPDNTQSSYTDVAVNQWFTGYAKYAYDHDLFNKPQLFPTNFMVRGEVAEVMYKLHQLGKI